jgi:hypothetical protein
LSPEIETGQGTIIRPYKKERKEKKQKEGGRKGGWEKGLSKRGGGGRQKGRKESDATENEKNLLFFLLRFHILNTQS